jgi:transposase
MRVVLALEKLHQHFLSERPVVSHYINEYVKSRLQYKDIKNISDSKLLELLGKKNCKSQKYKELSENFPYFTKELKGKGVTLEVLWKEYIAKYPNGYKYTQFCYHYQIWRQSDNATLHIEHKAGDKCFIDFTGVKLPVIDRLSGEIEYGRSICGHLRGQSADLC